MNCYPQKRKNTEVSVFFSMKRPLRCMKRVTKQLMKQLSAMKRASGTRLYSDISLTIITCKYNV